MSMNCVCLQVKIWFQNRRMKWRNSKERELLSSGGSRDSTLPSKDNPNPDLSDVSNNEDEGDEEETDRSAADDSSIMDMSVHPSTSGHEPMNMAVFAQPEVAGERDLSMGNLSNSDSAHPPHPALMFHHASMEQVSSSVCSNNYDAESSSDEEDEEIFVS